MSEDTKDADFVDDNDYPGKPEVLDGQPKFWMTRLLAIVQEPSPKDITPFLKPDVSLPIVKINIEGFESAS